MLGAGFSDLDAAVSRAWYGKKHVMNWLGRARAHLVARDRRSATLSGQGSRAAAPQSGRCQRQCGIGGRRPRSSQSRAAGGAGPVPQRFVEPGGLCTSAAHWLEKPFLSMGLGLLGFAGDYVECKPAPLSPSHAHHGDYDLWRDLGRKARSGGDWPETIETFWDTCLAPAHLDFATASSHLGPLFGRKPVRKRCRKHTLDARYAGMEHLPERSSSVRA